MRVTMLITMGIERPSGRRYFHLARGLVRQGHAVRILALHPDLPNCPQRRFIQDGVEVWYVGQMHARKSGSLPERFGPLALLRVVVTATLGMIWGVICSPADVYHLGKPQPINGMAALIAVSLIRRQRFYVDCDDDEVLSNRLPAAWQRAVFGFWQWLLPRLAAGVTVNTRYLQERLRKAGVDPIVLVPNGVNLEQFTVPPLVQREALRAALGLSDRRLVAYAGTLALQNHPVDLLIQAFGEVVRRIPTAALLMIGGGEDLPLLQQQVVQADLQDLVYFTGEVSHQSVPTLLSIADVSVDPVYDNKVAQARSPLKLVESMALGIPVITGDVGDRADVLLHGVAGVLVRPGDAAALAEAIIALLTDSQRQQRLSRESYIQSLHYSWERLAKIWATIYSTRAL
ncbi:glycosyltransferase family 4 protein [Candidatus Oscillochloris fontis]|uniref:glycosyltransferase family 4 protein n=1 Tax=Candidatus Oscillochloris fontis TaxID=2496868 RepID=UPI001EE80969|nr:glycosyltransferase family 4 protein [Candidatus Oscillochloris fontis]